MKLILSSCDFLNKNSKKVILDNLEKDINKCKILFIPNEKANHKSIYSDKYYNRLKEDGFINRDNIYIYDENRNDDFKNLDIDLIYIGGGNTFATLDKLKRTGFAEEIKRYIIDKNTTYIGGSSGAHIISKSIEHVEAFDNNYVGLKNYDGLGLFDGIIIPHYDSSRQSVYEELVKEQKYKVYKLTNNDSIVVNNDNVNVIRGI